MLLMFVSLFRLLLCCIATSHLWWNYCFSLKILPIWKTYIWNYVLGFICFAFIFTWQSCCMKTFCDDIQPNNSHDVILYSQHIFAFESGNTAAHRQHVIGTTSSCLFQFTGLRDQCVSAHDDRDANPSKGGRVIW